MAGSGFICNPNSPTREFASENIAQLAIRMRFRATLQARKNVGAARPQIFTALLI